MNKEAIERTKARCKANLIVSGLINPKPIYTTKEPIDGSKLNNEAATKKHYISAALVVIIILAIAITSNQAKADVYIKIGSGYKLIETEYVRRPNNEKVYFNTGGKLSARIEIGKEKGSWTYGIAHHSQWLSGFPFDDKEELQKTEIFIDYKWTL
jgi:hypothetical protein